MKRSAIICLSHGAYVRNVVYSELFTHLMERYKLVLLFPVGVTVPVADIPLLRGVPAITASIETHRFEKIFLFLRKNVFAGRERTQTFNLISEAEKQRHPLAYRVAALANAVLGRLPAVGRWWQRIEARCIPGREFDGLMAEHRPAFVITANYGTEALEVRLLRASHRAGVPTLAVVPSWDNLSSKGVIGENPRQLAVWNEIMRDEAKSLYGFDQAVVHVVGGLQFDPYGKPLAAERRDEVYQRLGIDPTQPFVVIGTITPRYFANNIDIVDILEAGVRDGQLPSNLQVVVRLHPQVIGDPQYGDDLTQYHLRTQRSPFIKLSVPRVLSWGSIRPPVQADTTELTVLLRDAVAAVMPATTLAIDACALGCPVIGIGFDGHQRKPYEQSVRRTFDFTHYRRIVAEGGLRIAQSPEQLLAEVRAYLADRSRDADGRPEVRAASADEVAHGHAHGAHGHHH